MKIEMKIKLLIICTVVSLLLGWVFSLYFGYTIVIATNLLNTKSVQHNKGDIINIFDEFDLNKGKWSVYLNLSLSDLKKLKGVLPERTCLKLTDVEVLRKMKDDWKMVYTGGDMATVESSIFIIRDGDIVFNSGIMFNKNTEGLQSPVYGWIEPIEKDIIKKYCKKFKPVFWPVVIL